MLTFGRLIGLRRIGIESSGHPRYFPLLLDLGIIAHFLFEVLELSGDGCTGPWSFELCAHLDTSLGVTQLDAFIGPSVGHVEDINKIINQQKQKHIRRWGRKDRDGCKSCLGGWNED